MLIKIIILTYIIIQIALFACFYYEARHAPTLPAYEVEEDSV